MPHILCLSETWLTTDFNDAECQLPQFCLYRSERPAHNGVSKHGGVLIGIASFLLHSPLKLNVTDNMDVIACRVTLASFSLLLVCIYNPPANSSYRWSLDKWESIFSELMRVKLPLDLVFITGDANLPGIDWVTLSSDDAYETHIVRLLERFNMLQVVDFNTTSSKLLDVVAVSSPDPIISVNIDDTFLGSYPFSDHYPISIAISVSEKEPVSTPMQRFSFAHADYASLSALISEFPFVGKCWSNPNVLLEEWHVWLRALMLRCIPFKTSHRNTLPPWVSPESSHLMKKLKTLKKKGAVKPSATIFQKIQYSEAVLSLKCS